MKYLFVILISLITILPAHSQDVNSPLQPKAPPDQIEAGMYMGIGQNLMSGQFVPACKTCLFETGTATGFSFGLLYERDIKSKYFRLGISAGYSIGGFMSAFRERESVEFTMESGMSEFSDVMFRHEAEVELGYLTAMPYAKFFPVEWFYFRLGFNAAMLMSNSMVHTKYLTQSTVTLSDDHIYDTFLPAGGRSRTLEDGEFPEAISFQYGISPALGFNFYVTDQFLLAPGFEYNLGLAKLSDAGDNNSLSSWRFLVELKMVIRYRKWGEGE